MDNTKLTTYRPRNADIFGKFQQMFQDPERHLARNLAIFDPWLDDIFSDSKLLRGDISFPKYNIVETENGFILELALAGYDKKDLTVELSPKNVLTVKTLNQSNSVDEMEKAVKETKPEDENTSHYIHRGIAAREFSISWQLTQHQEVKDAALKNGLLTINIVNNLPPEPESKVFKIK